MAARALAGLIVIGLALGIWILWPREDPVSGTTTTVDAVTAPTTVTLTGPIASSSTSTTAGLDDHIVETVEEAEAILRELWFGWFEGIYNQDEDRIREVVATEDQIEEARTVFGAAFTAAPSIEAIEIQEVQILRSDRECLATWALLDIAQFRGSGATSRSVLVARRVDSTWKILSTWISRDDLWEADCDSLL